MLQPTVSQLFAHIVMNTYTDIHAYLDVSCGMLFFSEMYDFYTRIYLENAPQTDLQYRQMFHDESPSSPAATHIQLGKGSGAP